MSVGCDVWSKDHLVWCRVCLGMFARGGAWRQVSKWCCVVQGMFRYVCRWWCVVSGLNEGRKILNLLKRTNHGFRS